MHNNTLNYEIGLETIKSDKTYKKSKRKFWDFEFMDLDGLPENLRATLRDVLFVNEQKPFRKYYDWVAEAIYSYANKHHIKEITELGAGSAPVTRALSEKYPNWDVKFNITDLHPDPLNYKELTQRDERINGVLDSVDFTQKTEKFQNSLLVLSAAFHHIPEQERLDAIKNLKDLSPHLMIFEPLRPKISSILLASCSFIPGLLTPFFHLKTDKFLRCALWCWLIPIAPFLLTWDGCISAIRCWSSSQWKNALPEVKTVNSLFCTKVILSEE